MAKNKQPIALQTQLTQAKYDADGFVQSYQTHLTEQQFEWLTWRMGTGTDAEACDFASIDQSLVDEWMTDVEFVQIRQQCMENKREAFRYLSSQLIPKTLRTINALLDADSISAQVRGANLLLRAQGLLIDKRVIADADAIMRLREALLAPSGHNVVDITPRIVSNE